jgi:hypothetical protein
MGDVRGNLVAIDNLKQVKSLTIWLSNEMIDWNKPVRVQVNGSIPKHFPQRGKAVQPNLEVLLEDYYDRGDRRQLFLNKIEINNIP